MSRLQHIPLFRSKPIAWVIGLALIVVVSSSPGFGYSFIDSLASLFGFSANTTESRAKTEELPQTTNETLTNSVMNLSTSAGQIPVTVGTDPTWLAFSVDSVAYYAPTVFNWDAGSQHTISAISPQAGGVLKSRYRFNDWSDGGAQSHFVTANMPATYTANFRNQYLLEMCCTNETHFIISPATGFFDQGQTVEIFGFQRMANFSFIGWYGYGVGSYSGQSFPGDIHTVVMNGPIQEYGYGEGLPTATNTDTPTSTPSATPTTSSTPTATATVPGMVDVTVGTIPPGQFMSVDSTTYFMTRTFRWAVGSSHTISVESPQNLTEWSRYVWNSWSDGGEQTHTITPTETTSVTAYFGSQYLLKVCCSGPNGSALPGGDFYFPGQSVEINAVAANGQTFLGWVGSGLINPNGSYTGPNPSATVTMTFGGITQTANFTGPTATATSTPTNTATPTPTNTFTPTATATNTATPTPTCFTVTTLSATEEVPPNGSPATGTGTVSVSADQTMITVTLSWSGLTSNATAAHIHGPAATGSTSGVLFGMAGVPNAMSGSIATQSFPITPTQLTQFQNGLFYWNVHSMTFSDGEIRGQILPGQCLASVSGTIFYGNAIGNPPAPRFVKNVSVASTSGSPAVGPVITGTPGTYMLTGFWAGSYTIKPTKPGTNGAITANDAARVAQGVSASVPFVSQNQRFAADVSGNGSISSNDAALIARFSAGIICTCSSGQWKFFVTGAPSPLPTPPQTYDDSRSYESVTGSLTGHDFVAILMGDVSGNYNPATHPRPGRTVVGGQMSDVGEDGGGLEKPITVTGQQLVTTVGKEIIIPVNVDSVKGKEIISYEFNLRYDPSVIQPLEYAVDLSGTVSRGLMVVTNPHEPGLLRVVVYGPMPIDENGLLLNLRFTAVGAAGSISPLTFERIMFNEGEPSVDATGGQVELF